MSIPQVATGRKKSTARAVQSKPAPSKHVHPKPSHLCNSTPAEVPFGSDEVCSVCGRLEQTERVAQPTETRKEVEMKSLKYACMTAALLALAACGQQEAPEAHLAPLDNTYADGDGLEGLVRSNLNFGSICTGESVTQNALIYIERKGSIGTDGGGKDVFANGARVNVRTGDISSALSANETIDLEC